MIPGIMPIILPRFVVGSPSTPSITYLGQTTGDGTGSTAESASLNLGTAHAGDKIVLIIAHALWSGSNDVLTGVNFNGSTNLVDSGVFRQGTDETVELFYYDDVSGSIGGSNTINCTWASAQANLCISAYRLTGAASGGPAVSTTDSTGNPTSTLSLNVLNNSMVVGMSFQRSNTDRSMTWTGLTEDFESFPSSQYNVSTASLLSTGAETPRTISSAWSATGVRAPVALSASFSPA